MHTDSSKYYDNAPSYFGEETIYTPIENLLKEKNIEIPNKYKYEFSQFTPPAFVFVKPNLTEYAIVLRFGDEVCKKPFQITTDPNENDEKN
ncbi:MAG: hypothetical protein IPM36_18635 [Lewinellaceae bacterium]|nr:hypothetical protein [Lewinellaceae bacterium]